MACVSLKSGMLINAHSSPMSPQICIYESRPCDFAYLLIPAIVSNCFCIDLWSPNHVVKWQILTIVYGVIPVLPSPLSVLSLNGLVGGYTTIFCWCMYMFQRCQTSRGHKIFLAGIILLFILCTPQCVLGSLSVILPLYNFTFANNTLYVLTKYDTNSSHERALTYFQSLIADSLFVCAPQKEWLWGIDLLKSHLLRHIIVMWSGVARSSLSGYPCF